MIRFELQGSKYFEPHPAALPLIASFPKLISPQNPFDLYYSHGQRIDF
jgi:hypothetical protein